MSKQEEKHVLLFSGGLDSYLAYLALKDHGYDLKLLYCDLGHRYAEQEKLSIATLPGLSNVIYDSSLTLAGWEQKDAFIPNRNGFLAMMASLYGNRIWMAIMDGEQTYSDCRRDTFFSLSYALSALAGEPVIVDSPFWNKTKAEVIGSLDPIYYNNLLKTTSCHNAHNYYPYHCGNCGACFRRWVAFTLNGIEDTFMTQPWTTPLAKEYREKAVTAEIYGPKRSREIVEAFRKVGIK